QGCRGAPLPGGVGGVPPPPFYSSKSRVWACPPQTLPCLSPDKRKRPAISRALLSVYPHSYGGKGLAGASVPDHDLPGLSANHRACPLWYGVGRGCEPVPLLAVADRVPPSIQVRPLSLRRRV